MRGNAWEHGAPGRDLERALSATDPDDPRGVLSRLLRWIESLPPTQRDLARQQLPALLGHAAFAPLHEDIEGLRALVPAAAEDEEEPPPNAPTAPAPNWWGGTTLAAVTGGRPGRVARVRRRRKGPRPRPPVPGTPPSALPPDYAPPSILAEGWSPPSALAGFERPSILPRGWRPPSIFPEGWTPPAALAGQPEPVSVAAWVDAFLRTLESPGVGGPSAAALRGPPVG